MKYKIEKNISFIEESTPKCEYPFDDMEIGDSFFVKLNKSSTKEKNNKGCSICQTGRKRSWHKSGKKLKKKNQREYSYRSYPNGLRIWRTK